MDKKGWVDPQGRKGKGYGVYRYDKKYGANVDHGTPLLVACRNGHLDIIRLLMEHGASVDADHATLQLVGIDAAHDQHSAAAPYDEDVVSSIPP